ncbi:unnamed protein product [Amoebophrya sp. A25]|nr:unnamed protein product [Amoebophrya sp. A25]|eukprot:GSA25T00025159001.1
MDILVKCLLKGDDRHAVEEAASPLFSEELNNPVRKLKGLTPLLYAIQSQELAAIQGLCRVTALDETAADEEGVTPLQHAVETGSHEVVDALLKGRPKLRPDWNAMLASGLLEGEEILEGLLQRAPESALADPESGATLLYALIAEGGSESAVSALLRLRPALVDEADPVTGDTPLMAAIKEKQNNLARVLLEVGKADVCKAEPLHGNTVLHIAVATNASSILQDMITRANPEVSEVKNLEGLTASELNLRSKAALETKKQASAAQSSREREAKADYRREKAREHRQASVDATDVAVWLEKNGLAALKETLVRRFSDMDALLNACRGKHAVSNLKKQLTRVEAEELVKAAGVEIAARLKAEQEAQEAERDWTEAEMRKIRFIFLGMIILFFVFLYFWLDAGAPGAHKFGIERDANVDPRRQRPAYSSGASGGRSKASSSGARDGSGRRSSRRNRDL